MRAASGRAGWVVSTWSRSARVPFGVAGVIACAVGLTGCASMARTTLDGPPDLPVAVSFAGRADPIPLGPRNTMTIRINGVPLDGVMLDTGATGMVIHPDAAARLDLPRVGGATVSSPGGSVESHHVWIERLQAGPLVIEHTGAVELDTGFIGRAGGGRVNAVVGAPLLEPAIAEIRLADRSLILHDREGYALPAGARWTPLRRVTNGYAVPAEFAGERGLFLLDTGAELGVQINGDVVGRLGLAETRDGEREGRRGRIRVMGGSFPTLRVEMEGIAFGGTRTAPVEADLILDPQHSLDGVAGLIGRDLIERFVLVLDATNSRAAFIPIKE